ncbi:MAG: hypothetical protein WCA07_08015 [Gloeobacterales cyanobacterium]
MATKRRLNEIAAQFGDKKDISIFLGREKIYPGQEISDQTLERLENALRSPESEQGSLRVQEGKALIYQSAKGELKLDTKGVAPAFQSALDQVQSMDATEQEYETLMQDAPVAENELERDKQFAEVALAQNITPEKYVNLLAHAPHTRDMMQQGTPVADITRNYLAPKMRDYLIAQQERGIEPVEREPGGKLMVAQSKQLIPIPVNAPQPELDRKMSEVLSPVAPQPEQAAPKTVEPSYELMNPPEASNHASLTQALEAANARIDALQTQLSETKAALQELSTHVKDNKLGTWATKQATEIGKTSQVIAVQAKSRVTQWMSSKVSEVKSLAHEKLNEGKTLAHEKLNEGKTFAQGKVDEFKIAAQLKAIEAKEALREKVNELLAPVNAQKLEASARYVIEHYGDGKSYDKAATHAFRLNDNNELSISRQSDSKVVFEGGSLTKAADSRDVLKLNTLPDFVAKVNAAVAEPEQRQEAEMGA